MSDELRIVLEDVKEKSDMVIEAFNMVKETLDRHREENTREHEGIINELMHLRVDLNEHRNNTELHGGKRGKKVS